MKSPVLFLTYRRYRTAAPVFDAIREAKPPKLYFASNAPNPDNDGEDQLVEQVRNLLKLVDWPCDVHTLFREKHLSVKYSISTAIDWFFEHEEEGIIIEDDVLPLQSFFPYCDELLERYRNNDQIAMISGCNFTSKRISFKESYFYTRIPHIQGWASWRRSWIHYDIEMKSWPEWRQENGLSKWLINHTSFISYWRNIFNNTYNKKVETWDYQWTYRCWRFGSLSISPKNNLINLIGFGSDATFTTGDIPSIIAESVPDELMFPLKHPAVIKTDDNADMIIFQNIFGVRRWSLFRVIRGIPILGGFLVIIKNLIKS
jgi:hypothetical protein